MGAGRVDDARLVNAGDAGRDDGHAVVAEGLEVAVAWRRSAAADGKVGRDDDVGNPRAGLELLAHLNLGEGLGLGLLSAAVEDKAARGGGERRVSKGPGARRSREGEIVRTGSAS